TEIISRHHIFEKKLYLSATGPPLTRWRSAPGAVELPAPSSAPGFHQGTAPAQGPMRSVSLSGAATREGHFVASAHPRVDRETTPHEACGWGTRARRTPSGPARTTPTGDVP